MNRKGWGAGRLKTLAGQIRITRNGDKIHLRDSTGLLLFRVCPIRQAFPKGLESLCFAASLHRMINLTTGGVDSGYLLFPESVI